MKKILIAIPCMDICTTRFAGALATMNKPEECTLNMQIGSLVYESRNKLVKYALSIKADYIFWLDSDVIPPKDVIDRMLVHMENGHEIVSGLYFRRSFPYTPVIYKSYKDGPERIEWEEYSHEDFPKEPLFKIAGCGFGCVMMKTEILFDLALNYRDFFTPIKASGEDISFCYRANELGHEIYCDQTIECKHVGYAEIDGSIWRQTANES